MKNVVKKSKFGHTKPRKHQASTGVPRVQSSLKEKRVINRTSKSSQKDDIDVHSDNANINNDEVDDFIPDQVPKRSSTPTVTDRVPIELNDNGIQMVQDFLHTHQPEVGGLQYVGLGLYNKSYLPSFESKCDMRFVQIMNVGDHWLCVTNVFGVRQCSKKTIVRLRDSADFCLVTLRQKFGDS